MKQIVGNPIMVSLEVGLIKDIVQIIGQSVHKFFAHDDVETVKQQLISKAQSAVQQHQASLSETQEKK